jgi:hypothetical protein
LGPVRSQINENPRENTSLPSRSSSTWVAIAVALFILASTTLSIALSTAVLSGGGGTSKGSTGPNASADNFNSGATVDTTSAIVELKGAPVSTYSGTRPPPGKKINFNNTAVQSYRAQLAAERSAFRNWLQANAPEVVITSQYDISLNAVAVQPGLSVFMTNCESYTYQKYPTTFTTFIAYGIDAALFKMFSGQVYPTASLQVTANQVWPMG